VVVRCIAALFGTSWVTRSASVAYRRSSASDSLRCGSAISWARR
jgi:hypothetical protein